VAGDIARSDKQTRAAVTRQIRDNIALVAILVRNNNRNDQVEKDKGTARAQAILTYCALVGALGVARAVSDEQLSRGILKTASAVFEEALLVNHSATSQR